MDIPWKSCNSIASPFTDKDFKAFTSLKFAGPIISLHKRINSRDHLKNFSNQGHHIAQALFPERNTIFKDDNTPIHSARIIKEWHEEHCNEVQHLVWPAQSLDLNIIEHL